MGAIIVAILAKKLQIPMAVAQKSVGNKELWAMYTRLNVEATAKEALSTKAGNTRGEVAEYPNVIIIKPVMFIIINDELKHNLAPKLLNKYPDTIRAAIEHPEKINPLM
jgi:hypothetical protein